MSEHIGIQHQEDECASWHGLCVHSALHPCTCVTIVYVNIWCTCILACLCMYRLCSSMSHMLVSLPCTHKPFMNAFVHLEQATRTMHSLVISHWLGSSYLSLSQFLGQMLWQFCLELSLWPWAMLPCCKDRYNSALRTGPCVLLCSAGALSCGYWLFFHLSCSC